MATSLDFLDPFITSEFGYTIDSEVDIEIQTQYDGSINIITTCEGTPPRIVNSRQKFTDTDVELIVLSNDNLDNVYDNLSINKTFLIPEVGNLVPRLKFEGVFTTSGKLLTGGYNYYFKLKTADGVESAVIEESRLVSVHKGTEFGKSKTFIENEYTTNTVKFTLNNLDGNIYRYVSVYYTRSTGATASIVKTTHKIGKDFEIFDNYCTIVHTGFENDIDIDASEIIASYSPISSALTVTQKNNRLVLGKIQTNIDAGNTLQQAALCCYVEKTLPTSFYIEQSVYNGNTLYKDSYADPNNIYHKTAYFPGETYEFAINFVYKSGAVSDAYPIMGIDWSTSTSLNHSLLGTTIDSTNGWIGTQNIFGIVRMQDVSLNSLMHSKSVNQSHAKMDVKTMAINTTKMISDYASMLYNDLNIRSYFISRKPRRPDLLMEGLVTYAATANVSSMHNHLSTTYTFGTALGYGFEGSMKNNLVLFPVPGRAMPFSTESVYGGDVEDSGDEENPTPTALTTGFDGVLYAPLPRQDSNGYYTFYSPDITSDTASAALINTNSAYSLFLDAVLHQNIGYTQQKVINPYGSLDYAVCAVTANVGHLTTVSNIPFVKQILKAQFINDAQSAFTNLGFTSKLDRQVAFLAHKVLNSSALNGSGGLLRSTQLNFSVASLNRSEDDFYITNTLHRDYVDGDLEFLNVPEGIYTRVLLTGVNYSPYLALNVDSAINVRLNSLLNTPINYYFTAFESGSQIPIPSTATTPLGVVSKIYLNSKGEKLNLTDWLSTYKNISAGNYFAISERFAISKQLQGSAGMHSGSFLKGGDCYAGFYYQQVWRPGGIAGIPTANNASTYIFKDGDEESGESREGVNITNSGYAIGFPTRSKFNFALRAEQTVDDVEEKLFGKKRTYTSGAPTDSIQGNRQPETSIINYGNVIHDSIITYTAFDATIPYLKLEYNNRLMVSEASAKGEFENSYRNFKGLNFKDYDEDLGTITAVIGSSNYVYIVYTNGVSLVEISERSAISSDNASSKIYIGSSDVLPLKSTPIFNNSGSQHLSSVISTEVGIFGVDAESKKIWRIAGTEKKIISDTFIQSILNNFITTSLKNINSSYDVTFNEVTFTFTYNDDSHKSILYDTANNLWNGTTDIHKLYQFNIEDVQFSLLKPHNTSLYSLYFPVINNENNILCKDVGKVAAIDDVENNTKEVYDSYIEFVIKNSQTLKFDLSNIIINGIGVPSAIDVITDNIEEYALESADSGVLGLNQQNLPVHTNVYMQDATTGITVLDTYKFERIRNTGLKTLNVGDKITLDFEGSLQQFVIANISFDGINTDTIILNTPMIGSTISAIYYGWKIPLRISLGESMAGKTKLTIPSKKHANLLKGITQTNQNNHVNYANAKPYGRWVKLRLHFKGTDQIYINSIMSETVLRYI